MNIITKKIIAKEIVYILLVIVIPFMIWVILNLNNSYQTNVQNNNEKEKRSLNLVKDSLVKIITKYEHKRLRVFDQICIIEGGVMKGEDPLQILLPIFVNINEPIGGWDFNEFEEFGGDVLHFKNLSNGITYNSFYDSLKNNISYNETIFNKLYKSYNDSSCRTINKFNQIIGLKELDDLINKRSKILLDISHKENSIKKSIERTLTSLEIKTYTFNTVLFLLIVLFGLRYLYYSAKWSISILSQKS
jgi:hypothetical protein